MLSRRVVNDRRIKYIGGISLFSLSLSRDCLRPDLIICNEFASYYLLFAVADCSSLLNM